MARVIKTTAYSYDELSDQAKERARDWYREGNLEGYDWWKSVYEDAKTIGALMGIDIRDIWFSGFYSQGSGAAMDADYSYRKGWRKALRAEFGGGWLIDMEKIGQALQDAQRPVFYTASAACQSNGSNWTHVSVEMDDVISQDVFTRTEDAITEALRDFANWIYEQLEAEHDYLQSDEAVEAAIVSMGYEFTEDGEIV